MRKKWVWILVGVVVLGAGGAFVASKRGPKPTPVQLADVEREDLQAKVAANGKIQAQKKVEISATIMGQITQLAVREGDAVKKGQFLLEIDPANPRAAARSSEASMQALLRDVESARANLELAKNDFERARANFEAKIIPRADYERAETGVTTSEAMLRSAERRVEQARAQLEGAKDTLSKTIVRAPIDGIVTARRVEEGEVAVIGIQNSPGTVLLTISDMSVVETELEVDEASIPQVKLGQEVKLRIDAYPNRTFNGVVTEVGSSPILLSSSVDQAVKFKVKAQIKDPPEGIKPGLTAQADILTGFAPQVLAVPIQSIVLREKERPAGTQPQVGEAREEEGVYVIEGAKEEGKVAFLPITTGLMGELSIEVKEGLKGDEKVVSGPFKVLRTLKPGDLVVKEKEPPEGTAAGGEADEG